MASCLDSVRNLERVLDDIQEDPKWETKGLPGLWNESEKIAITRESLGDDHKRYQEKFKDIEDSKAKKALKGLAKKVVSLLSKALYKIELLSRHHNDKQNLPDGHTPMSLAVGAFRNVIKAMKCFDVVAGATKLNEEQSKQRVLVVKYYKLALKTALVLGWLITPRLYSWWYEWEQDLEKSSSMFEFETLQTISSTTIAESLSG